MPNESLRPAAYAELGQLIDSVQDPNFWRQVCELIILQCPFDQAAVFHYAGSQSPRRIFDLNPSPERDRLHNELLDAAYLIGPYYNNLVRSRASDGFYSINEIAPDAFRDSEYYRIYYREKHAADEGMFFITVRPRVAIGLLAERSEPASTLSEDDVQGLKSLSHLLCALIRLRWELVESTNQQTPFTSNQMVTALECFGRNTLSERERQIAELILKGHSSKSGAKLLGISPETERVHRKRLYSKLAISSQAELFWMFIQSVAHYRPAEGNDPLESFLQSNAR